MSKDTSKSPLQSLAEQQAAQIDFLKQFFPLDNESLAQLLDQIPDVQKQRAAADLAQIKLNRETATADWQDNFAQKVSALEARLNRRLSREEMSWLKQQEQSAAAAHQTWQNRRQQLDLTPPSVSANNNDVCPPFLSRRLGSSASQPETRSKRKKTR